MLNLISKATRRYFLWRGFLFGLLTVEVQHEFPMLTLSTKNYHVVKAIVGHLSTKMIIFRGVG